MFHWFSPIRYNPKYGMLECGISPELKPYLLHMQSEYSIRIYEILKKYEKIAYVVLKLEKLHDLLVVPKSFRNCHNH